MDAHIEENIVHLRRIYRGVMTGILALAVLVFALDQLYPDVTTLSRKGALISKSVMIILFLSIIPLLLSYFRKRLGKMPGEADPTWKMWVYKRQFYIKASVLSALCLLSMVVFILSGDPMILILLLAGVLFLYFERPSRLKISDDLGLEEHT